uniref:Rho termination factor N-terminal domain-containing protein n=1 Tax=viral metagenome TaxID=1070528 RepID=A0A6C0H1S3_9ZZZZ
MGFFNLIESFFFISLAITFVLILLLVYHFKQRVVTLEQKCDTMFDIINNVVKELNSVRNYQLATQRVPLSMNIPFNNQSNIRMCEEISKIPVSEDDESSVESSDVGDSGDEEDTEEDAEGDAEGDTEGDKEDEDAEEDAERDADEDADEDEEDEDAERDAEGDESKTGSIVHVTNIEDTDTVKIITVDIGEIDKLPEDIDFENDIENEIDNTIDENNVNSQGLLNSSWEMTDKDITHPNTETIHVEKLEETNEDKTLDVTDVNQATEQQKDIYRRMPIQSLKALVISKGLCSDPSKMKKLDLVRMLENADE